MKKHPTVYRKRSFTGFTLKGISKVLVLILPMVIVLSSFGQSGSLKGIIKDKETGEAIPFANIVLSTDSTLHAGGVSDYEGNYYIKPISNGNYDLKVYYVGYKTFIVKDLEFITGTVCIYDIEMEAEIIMLEEFVVDVYKIPFMDIDFTCGGGFREGHSSECYGNVGGVQSDTVVSFCCVGSYKSGELPPFDVGYNPELNTKGNQAETLETINEQKWMKAYPNPTRGPITIEYGKKVKEVFLTDMSGKIIKRVYTESNKKTQFDLFDLPNGMYLLKYANVDHWEYVKIILKH